jgi:hypothetical protein
LEDESTLEGLSLPLEFSEKGKEFFNSNNIDNGIQIELLGLFADIFIEVV